MSTPFSTGEKIFIVLNVAFIAVFGYMAYVAYTSGESYWMSLFFAVGSLFSLVGILTRHNNAGAVGDAGATIGGLLSAV